ncbi:hypothetical protein DYH55_12435 [Methylovirgula sp. 4M-Z18]|nr:hypothetical protein DYH55_12435 [Methylovirgula sp. 4M-Z18]
MDRFSLEFSACFSWLGKERKTMKASKFSDAQRAFILKQGNDGVAVADIFRRPRPPLASHWRRIRLFVNRHQR